MTTYLHTKRENFWISTLKSEGKKQDAFKNCLIVKKINILCPILMQFGEKKINP